MEETTTSDLGPPPILSTPDTHILEEANPPAHIRDSNGTTEEQLKVIYEIERTVREIRDAKWRRVALQFPDDMLPDAPRVFQVLSRGVKVKAPVEQAEGSDRSFVTKLIETVSEVDLNAGENDTRFYILADTSYGACCVDEIAAEHIYADAVVHYGRSCLSPTARLPVIHVFTQRSLELEPVFQAFKNTYPDKDTKIIITADVLFSSHISHIYEALKDEGFANLFATSVIHDPSSPIPNRTVPEEVDDDSTALHKWHLFHISDPPTSLLLTLSSRVASIHIYPTDGIEAAVTSKPLLASTAIALRRRYALLTSLNTVSVFGILINTLSVKNYLHMVEHVKDQIAAAGKKSYMFVVGKLNAAKVANFSEIGGWVVIGCWESSLVDSKDFWRPVITPFELDLVLKGDAERVWTGEWKSNFQHILDAAGEKEASSSSNGHSNEDSAGTSKELDGGEINVDDEISSEPESAPPEFDLRTGRYVSHTRPMEVSSLNPSSQANGTSKSSALTKRTKGELATMGNAVSPGAEFLRSKRTWKGLGSDFDVQHEGDGAGAQVEEGRSGTARGYVVGGDSADRR
jgi:diphthamide biosynthesis protein 2